MIPQWQQQSPKVTFSVREFLRTFKVGLIIGAGLLVIALSTAYNAAGYWMAITFAFIAGFYFAMAIYGYFCLKYEHLIAYYLGEVARAKKR